jgi:hypothetical protein
MARTAAAATQDITQAGLNPVMTAAPNAGAGNGITFGSSGNEFLIVTTSGTVATLTLDATGRIDGVALADPTVTLPATGTRYIGPFGPGAFGGSVGVDFSVITGVTYAVVRLPRA